MSVRADDGGRGDTPGEKSAIGVTEAEVEAVGEEIRAVGQDIDNAEEEIRAVKAALSGGPPYLGISDRYLLFEEKKSLQKEKEQLWKEKEQLRKKKEQLRKKKEQLRKEKERQRTAQALLFSASKNVTNFAAALTGATVTDNLLELANDTFFLGDSTLGSKLFIRPCYKELSEIIFSGASSGTLRNIVVTGTSGIGKSLFGYYLLYLLRCQGKTVVFERKGVWYRFSDEGVEEGEYFDFFDARYFRNDLNSWYLSDPEDRPVQRLAGTTVVLVSTKAKRVNSFLKQAKSAPFFMPVFSLDELLECRRCIFPDVPTTDVESAFDYVGGVARAVFDMNQLEALKQEMMSAARRLSVDLLQDVLWPDQKPSFDTEGIGHALIHIVQGDKKNFGNYKVAVGSKYATELIYQAIFERGGKFFENFVRGVSRNPLLQKALEACTWSNVLEKVAHRLISGEQGSVKPKFKVISLTGGDGEDGMGENFFIGGGGEDGMGVKHLSLDFTGWEALKCGNAFPETFAMSTYYVPDSPKFASINSFGVDERSNTLFFFLMKSAGVVAVNGKWVEEYWDIAVSNLASIKRCVYVYVVPEGEVWEKAIKLREGGDWLTEASDDFKSACRVCVIQIPVSVDGSAAEPGTRES